jgi:DNA-binding MarR family transcriptional regulator
MLSSVVNDTQIGQKISRDEADLLGYIQQFGSITLAEAQDVLPTTPRRTIQRKLKSLVDAGYIELDGATHSARYFERKK